MLCVSEEHLILRRSPEGSCVVRCAFWAAGESLALAVNWQQNRPFRYFAKAVKIRGEWVAKIGQRWWYKGQCLSLPGVRRKLVPDLPANLKFGFAHRISGGGFNQGASAKACASRQRSMPSCWLLKVGVYRHRVHPS
jgi:hypothetical protein